MATISFVSAWRGAENRCMAYFLSRLESVEDLQAYRAEAPIHFDPDNTSLWSFEIFGGGEAVRTNTTRVSFPSWKMGARIRGVFADRDKAMEFCGLLWDSLPIANGDDKLSGITYLCMTDHPTIERDTIEKSPDLDTGGEMRVWTVNIPMEVVFTYNAAEAG